ncbi:methyl-accepting chemotaxis protein [Andreprevotia chitinilytica]|uniref:methyl-accepting chemotaxis protein n=1 Tax=Andreprevotia chitinilytica TaxID=396808 RepID=UPI0014703D05|nr:methyl-accepting chemotaxis protein [Andreprevotia chitinilytica]
MLWQKFAILGVLGALLVGPPLYLYIRDTNVGIDASVIEQSGIGSGKAALQFLQQVQQHRGLSAAFLGANQLADKRQAKQAEADETLKSLEAQLKDADATTKAQLTQLHSDWAALEGGVTGHSVSVLESYNKHTALCISILKFIEQIADMSGLSLDPDADTYYLMRAVYFDTPALAEALGETRAKGASILATKQIDANSRALMSGLIAQSVSVNDQMASTFGKAIAANASLKDKLDALLADATKNAKDAAALGNGKVALAEQPDYPAPDYIAFFTRSIDSQFKVIDVAMGQLEMLIAKRISTQRTTRNLLTGGVMLIAVIAALVGWVIAASILTPVQHALKAVQAVAQGDLSTRIVGEGRSETGQMLSALIAMQVALRETIGATLRNADDVAQAATEMAAGSNQVSAASSQQGEASASMAAAVEQLTVSIGHVTNNAGEAQHASASAEELSVEGTKVIQGAATSIRGVADQIRATAAMISDLGEQSQRISGIVSVIRDVAEQTNLLALNAAIEAARAGEQGRGFAVVADEVRKLAERTNGATREIGDMIKRIQEMTADAVAGMNGAVVTVDGGVNLANQAAEAIEKISLSAADVESAIDVISVALHEQMTASNQIAINVERIAQMSDENSSSAQSSAQAARSLQSLAMEMRNGVARFRLH